MSKKTLISNILAGRSLLRSYQNSYISGMPMLGKGIDLGAKSSNAGYYGYLNIISLDDLSFVDLYHSDSKIIQVDLEEIFPIQDNQFNFVLAFNVMEHLFDSKNFLSESFRIAAPGAEMHVMVPFLHQIHPDPHDYHRFTDESLMKWLKLSGFVDCVVEPTGSGPFKVGAAMVIPLLGKSVFVRPIALAFYVTAIFLDKILGYFSTEAIRRFPLGYYAKARKPLRM